MSRRSCLAALLVAALAASCTYTASLSVAPNGVIWVARNYTGTFTSGAAEGIYACVPSGAELRCARMRTPGMD
jgi:hypothetical protein